MDARLRTRLDASDVLQEAYLELAGDLDAYRASMIRSMREERVRNYLAALRAEAKVVDNRDKVLQQTNAQQQTPLTPS